MAVDLSGRVACVTGAKQGFGRATADRLAEFGAEVICADIDPSIVSDERISDNRRQHGVVCDVLKQSPRTFRLCSRRVRGTS